MIYLDANFFIFAVLDTTKKGESARNLQRTIANGEEKACTSVLTIDEVMWVLLRNGKKEFLRKIIKEIYALPNVEIHGMSSLTPLRGLEFMEKYSLKPRDALHVATMIELGIQKIVSDDGDFDKVKDITR